MKKALYLFAIAILGPALMAAANEAYQNTESVKDLYANHNATVSDDVENAISQMSELVPKEWIDIMANSGCSLVDARNRVARYFLLQADYEAVYIDAALAIINLIII